MSWIVTLFASQSYPFTVDRVEPPWAVVEWANLELTHLPLESFPIHSPPEEGGQYTIRLLPSRSGLQVHQQQPIILEHHRGLIAFPDTFDMLRLQFPIPSLPKEATHACSLFRSPSCYALLIQSQAEPQTEYSAGVVLD